jgi:hypothetical protein
MAARIKVISLQQPWARLVVQGDKQYETRGWKTPYRGDLYIHASKNIPEFTLELLRTDRHFKNAIPNPTKDIVTGAIIGKVKLLDCISTNDEKFIKSLTEKEKAFGDFTKDRWAWLLEKPVKTIPIFCRGALSIWEFEIP